MPSTAQDLTREEELEVENKILRELLSQHVEHVDEEVALYVSVVSSLVDLDAEGLIELVEA